MASKTLKERNENVNVSHKMNRSTSQEYLEELREIINQRELSQNERMLNHFQWLLEDDKFLYHFIRGCKYSTNKAFSKLQTFLQQRIHYSDLIQLMIPSKMNEIAKVLKHRGPNGEFIIVQKASDWDTTKQSADEYIASCLGSQEVVWEDELTEKNGAIGVWDTSGFGLSHLRQLGPRAAKVINLCYNAYPVRVKAVYVVNAPIYFIALYTAVKYLLPKKFRERLFIHGKNHHESLFSLVPQESLPDFLGGSASDSEAFRDDMFPAILAKESFYTNNTTLGTSSVKKAADDRRINNLS